jgi:hypothetical protein
LPILERGALPGPEETEEPDVPYGEYVFESDAVFYCIHTKTEAAVLKAGSQMDSVQVEGAMIKFYKANEAIYSNALSNVDSITFVTESQIVPISPYYMIGDAHNPNWTILGAELSGLSISGISQWTATGVSLKSGAFKLVKAPGGAIDWNSGIGYATNGSFEVSSTSKSLYVPEVGIYNITLTLDETSGRFTKLTLVNTITGTVTIYSATAGITINDVPMPVTFTLSGTLGSFTVEYPYPATNTVTFNNGGTLTASVSLNGYTYDNRFFSVSGNTITYIGQSGQKWTLSVNPITKTIAIVTPDNTMALPDALWVTGANFYDMQFSPGVNIIWNARVILKRISATKYESTFIAIQNEETSGANPGVLGIVPSFSSWDYITPAQFASLPDGLVPWTGGVVCFQSLDFGGIYTLTVDLAGGSGNYTITFVKTGTLQ